MGVLDLLECELVRYYYLRLLGDNLLRIDLSESGYLLRDQVNFQQFVNVADECIASGGPKIRRVMIYPRAAAYIIQFCPDYC